MPLFAAISGYLLYSSVQKYSLKEMVFNRFYRLLIPIISWNAVANIYDIMKDIAKSIGGGEYNLKNYILGFFKIYQTGWFLWSMLGLSLGVVFVHHLFKDNLAVYILGFFATFFLPKVSILLWLYPFFVGAYLIAKNKEKIGRIGSYLKNPVSIFALIILHLLLVVFWKHDYYIYTPTGLSITFWEQTDLLRYIVAALYRIIAGCTGIIMCTAVAVVLTEKFRNIGKNTFVLVCSKYSIGIYMFSVYILNNIMLHIMPIYGCNYFINLLESMVILIISLFVIFIII